MIVFPHSSLANSKKDSEEIATNDYFCNLYAAAFGVSVIYINSFGRLEYMPGIMGLKMKIARFTMNGKTKIYTDTGEKIPFCINEAKSYTIKLSEEKRKKDILFYGNDSIKGNSFFQYIILKPDILMGIRHTRKFKGGIKIAEKDYNDFNILFSSSTPSWMRQK